jgi:hypothetical protein
MSKRDRYQFDEEDSAESVKISQAEVFPGSPPPPPVPFRRPQGGAILQEGQLTVGAFKLTESGLEISGSATHEDWGKVGELLFKLEGSIQWLIGDWLVYGEDLTYGDLIARVEATGRHYDTVRNYMVVCRAFELSRRRYNLSFGHYQAAASLSDNDQDEALAYAEKNKLSVASFRKMVQAHIDPASKELPGGDAPSFKALVSSFDKLKQKDPSKAKPHEREQAHEVGRQMMQAVLDYYRQWGISD